MTASRPATSSGARGKPCPHPQLRPLVPPELAHPPEVLHVQNCILPAHSSMVQRMRGNYSSAENLRYRSM